MGIIQQIPLAALGDLLEVVIPIILMILYIVGQLLASKNPKNQGQPRPKRPDHPRPNRLPPEAGPLHTEVVRGAKVAGKAERGRAVGEPIRLEEALRIEVDEFLRRAQGKSRQHKPQSQRPDEGPPAPNRSHGSMARTHRGKTPSQQGAQPGQRADRHLLPPAQTARPFRSATLPSEQPKQDLSVADHVATHVSAGSRNIGQHAEHLVDDLAQTDERVEARLHQKFDHSVGRLQHVKVAERDTSSGIAHEISQMLAKPEGIRQLIIANEILRRPHF